MTTYPLLAAYDATNQTIYIEGPARRISPRQETTVREGGEAP